MSPRGPGTAPPLRVVGDDEVAANFGLVYHQLHRMGFREEIDPDEYEDLVQVGRLALWEALRRWQPAKGARSTYCCAYIWGNVLRHRRRVTRAVGYHDPSKRRIAEVGSYEAMQCIPTDGTAEYALPPASRADTAEEAHWLHLVHRLGEDLAQLPDQLRAVAQRCLINGEPQRQVARDLGLSNNKVCALAREAREILGAPFREAA